jgi:predicted nucleic acid-binding protein
MNTYLLDTNILVYGYNKDSDLHIQASTIIQDALDHDIDAFIADKTLFEFYAIITDPSRVEKPVSINSAIEVIKFIMNSKIKILLPTQNTLQILTELLQKYRIKKQGIFDLIIASLAIENKVNAILTRNVKDFSKIEEINVINPFTEE